MSAVLPHISATRLAQIRTELGEATQLEDPAGMVDRLVEIAGRHTRSEMTVWGYRQPDRSHHIRWLPEKLELRRHDDAYEQLVHEHPVRNRYLDSGSHGPHRLSDAISLGRFKDSGLYRDYFRHFGVTRLAAVYVPLGRGTHLSLGVSRGGRDFNEEDMETLALLRPHIAEAFLRWQRIETTERLFAVAEDALVRIGRGLIVIAASGVVEHATPSASRWLAGACGVEAVHGRQASAALMGIAQRATRGTLLMHGASGSVTVRRMPRVGETVLLVEGPRPSRDLEEYRRLGLTLREAEILGWIGEGRTNVELAAILGIAPATVKKHLENIYRKLGVENRMSAVQLATALLGL
jgi:DNA-binding CsgD family transcriptional regulator